MTTIVLNPANGEKNRVGYDNLLERGVVLASSEDAGYPVKNCFDWNTADFYRPDTSGEITVEVTLPAASSANYLAFYNQDLFKNGSTIKLQYHDGANFVDACEAYAPVDNKPRMIFFDSQTSNRWRLVFECTVIFNLGVVAFGTYMAIPHGQYIGWTPPRLARANKTTNNVSESGSFLGMSVFSYGFKTTLDMLANDAWVRANWEPFMAHYEGKPFFWCPNYSDYPNEFAFCWKDGEVSPPVHAYYGYMKASQAIQGLVA